MADTAPDESAKGSLASSAAAVLQTIATSNSESAEKRFGKLKQLIDSGEGGVPEKALCDCVLNVLVNGQFDAEHNFVIADAGAVRQLEAFLESSPTKLQCEIWGVVCAMVKRSRRNVLRCIEAELIEFLLSELQKDTTTRTLADLIIELLSVLTTFSVTTKQLRLIVAALRARNSVWPRYSVPLLNVLRLMPQRSGPDEFFSFSGKCGSAICLPPLSKWPSERGWAFSTWFYLDPVYGAAIERERPFLYVFKSSRGVGYSANFVGQSLVLTCLRMKGKGYQHCVKFEFATRKWYHLAVSYVYNRWSKNEVLVYVNGELVSQAELNWLVAANEPFDRCFLGTSSDQDLDCMFSGCLGAAYGFCEALNTQQVAALYHLGPNYQNQFRFGNELLSTGAANRCDEAERRVIFGETRLSNALLFLYNPVACDSQLCLNQASKSTAAQYFVHSPHAMMQPEVRAVSTSSICTALHSLGGIQVLYPLFSQLDSAFADDLSAPSSNTQAEGQAAQPPVQQPQIAAALMSLIVNLLEHSSVVQQQLAASRGFLVIACQLERANASHLTVALFETIVHAARHLLASAQCNSGDLTLQRQLFDYLLFNPSLWIRAPAAVQIRLYAFLASETVVASALYSGNAVRRTSAVLQAFHTLKYYYWIVNPRDRSGIEPKPVALSNRPERKELVGIRTCVLTHVAQLISRAHGVASEELQAVLNYLSTVNEDENLPDVLQFAVRLIADYPASLVPAFDAQFGVRTVFKLLASADEHIRILALKLLGFFLLRSTLKRKTDAMNAQNLFALLGDRLLLHADRISMSVYNTLMEILCERLTQTIHNERRVELDANARIENPQLLKTMAMLILAARDRDSTAAELRKVFLLDLLLLCSNSRENRRIVLQQSVWQDWLFALAFLRPRDDFEHLVTNCVMLLFRSLLYHAIRYEYGGWRVWIDTLAVFHSKISADEFRLHIDRLYRTAQLNAGRTQSVRVSSAEQRTREHRRSDTEPLSTSSAAVPVPTSSVASAQDQPDVATVRALDPTNLPLTPPIPAPAAATTAKAEHDAHEQPNNAPSHQQLDPVPDSTDLSAPTQTPATTTTETAVTVATETAATTATETLPAPPAPAAANQQALAQPQTQQQMTVQRRLPGRVASPRAQLAPPAFRIPEFRWTAFHLRLLNDLLILVEQDVYLWKCDRSKTIVDLLNVSENQIYIQNTIHLISQLCDGLISSCGGLLPLLAAGTSPTGEIDVLEIGHGLSIEIAMFYLNRLMNLADVFVFGSTASLADLEQEKNMARGGIMRQCLRMISMCAIRSLIECRLRQYAEYRVVFQPGAHSSAPSDVTRPPSLVNTTTSPSNFISASRARVSSGSVAQAMQSTGAINALLNGYYRIVAVAGSPASTDATSMTSPFSGVRHSVSVAQETIRDLQSLLQPIRDCEKLLQDVDVNRLRAAIYRDLEETKQAQFLSLASLYFISVLMVSRYRDILEPPNLHASLTSVATRNGESDARPDTQPDCVEVEPDAETDTEADSAPVAAPNADTASATAAQRQRRTVNVDAEVHVDSVAESENESSSSPVKNKQPAESTAEIQTQLQSTSQLDGDVQNAPAQVETNGHETETQSEKAADDPVDAEHRPSAPTEFTELGTTVQEDAEKPQVQVQETETRENEAANARKDDQVASISVDQPKIATINLDEPEAEPPLSASESSTPDRTPLSERRQQSTVSAASTSAVQPQPVAQTQPQQQPQPQPQPRVTVGSEMGMPASLDGESVTTKMERAMNGSVPLLKEILTDFGTFLSRTLVGSHGQELVLAGLNKLNVAAAAGAAAGSVGGRNSGTISSSSLLVETVMLLCSQEWQNSLQKNAGLAFIELVNEGRLLAHATREHIVRVANEAEFILNRMRADDVQKHAAFEALCAQSTHSRLEEERLCDNLISAARARDLLLARRLKEKIVTIISMTRGPWFSPRRTAREFWRLDGWEDDSRRRRRLVRNPLGSAHADAAFSRSSTRPGTGTENNNSRLAPDSETQGTVSGKSPDVVALAGSGPLVNPSQPQTATSAYISDEELLNMGTESEKELVDESSGLLASSGPIVLALRCRLIAPGVAIVGQLSVTKSDLYFEMDDNDPENAQLDATVLSYVEHAHGRWQFNEIRAIFSRRYLLQNVALEIFLSNRSAIMFAFADQASVRKLVYALPRVGVGMKYGIKPSRKASLATPRQLVKLSDMTAKWQRREISNFDYLMFLNTVSGRTFNDLNQYPVFPWVLVNYDSTELDLTNPSNFRDLSKPIGALNPTRRSFFEERYQNWDDSTIPPFHYGTHYSTAAYVLNFMVRVEPFASIYLALQGGRFDHANRLFASVPQCWRNCQRDTSDVKELTPEFFYLAEMFENRNCFDLGETDEHVRVGNVELPGWARTPEDFVRINRQALESEFVSCQLHSWIDLIFGYKQRGPESLRATNVFYYLTYEGAVNLADLHDQVLRQAVENQIRNFGQTPAQLLTEPHPPRSSIMHISPLMFTRTALLDPIAFKFVSNSPLVAVAANSHPFLSQPAILTVAANRTFTVNKWLGAAGVNQPVASPPSSGGPPSLPQAGQQSQNTAGAAPTTITVPIQLDPLMYQTVSSGAPASGAGAQSRRALGDAYDQRLAPTSTHFVVTADNRAVLACGFWDRSLRAFSTADARVLQVVYGHFDVVTCVVRSECNVNQDCYIVTGSRDCTLMLWLWNAKQQAIVNETGQSENPQPRSTYYGHQSEIVCASVSAELGLVVSGSRDGACLIHTLVGELLQWLVIETPLGSSISNGHVELQTQSSNDGSSSAPEQSVSSTELRRTNSVAQGDQAQTPELVLTHREGIVVVKYGRSRLAVYTINGKLLNHVEHRDQVNAIALTRDGQYLVVGTEHGAVEIWQVHDLSHLHSFAQLDVAVRSLFMTHDQRFIVAGASSGTLILYNVDFNRWHYEFRDRYRT